MLLKVDPKHAHRYFVKMKNPIAITKAAKIAPPMKLAMLKGLPPSVSAFEIDCVVLAEEVLDDGVVGNDVLFVTDVSVMAGVEDVPSNVVELLEVCNVVFAVEFVADDAVVVVVVVLVLVDETVMAFEGFTGTSPVDVRFPFAASLSSKLQRSSLQKQNKVDLFNELNGPEHSVLFSVAQPRS